MPSPEEPTKQAAAAADPELDATDGGWDPYVTSLLLGAGNGRADDSDDAEDGPPVMSFSQVPRTRGRS